MKKVCMIKIKKQKYSRQLEEIKYLEKFMIP